MRYKVNAHDDALIGCKIHPFDRLEKSLVLAQCCVQQLCALCVYGVGFLCLMILGITAHTLLNGQHLHLTASIDGQEQMVLDLRPNTK
jgi:hypothetical protein